MKIIEKMAHDWSIERADAYKKKFPRINTAGFDNDAISESFAYQAGFRAAREMAANEYSFNPHRSKELQVSVFLNLGEQEIEDKSGAI